MFELVDEIRNIVLAIYGADIQEAARQQHQAPSAEMPVISDDDVPF